MLIFLFLKVPSVAPANVSGGNGRRHELVILWEVGHPKLLQELHYYICVNTQMLQCVHKNLFNMHLLKDLNTDYLIIIFVVSCCFYKYNFSVSI